MALQAGARHKASEIEGIGLEFYTENWDTVEAAYCDHFGTRAF